MLALLFTSFFLVSNCFSAIINVPNDYESIQGGIDATDDGDTVLVQLGVYQENVSIPGRDLTIASLILTTGREEYIDSTIIYGRGAASGINLTNVDDDVLIEGFTIRNGGGNYGGGIDCNGSDPTLRNFKIVGNRSNFRGGGISVRAGASPLIECVDVIGNSSMFGGGISVE